MLKPIRRPIIYFIYENDVYSGMYLLENLIERGIKKDTLVWTTETEQWVKAEEIEELKDYFKKKQKGIGNR